MSKYFILAFMYPLLKRYYPEDCLELPINNLPNASRNDIIFHKEILRNQLFLRNCAAY